MRVFRIELADGAEPQEQGGIHGVDLLAACGTTNQCRDRLLSIIEIVQVLIQPHPVPAHDIALEHALLRRVEKAVIGERLGQHILAVDQGSGRE